jgi:hypothetical protein
LVKSNVWKAPEKDGACCFRRAGIQTGRARRLLERLLGGSEHVALMSARRAILELEMPAPEIAVVQQAEGMLLKRTTELEARLAHLEATKKQAKPPNQRQPQRFPLTWENSSQSCAGKSRI